MSIDVMCNNCGGHELKIVQDAGVASHRITSKLHRGKLALQSFPDRPYRRITFLDNGTALGQRIFKSARSILMPSFKNFSAAMRDYASDALCHFDFSSSELESGKKRIEYQIQVFPDGSAVFGLICYDLVAMTGRMYAFSAPEDANQFADAIGLRDAVLLDDEGKEMKRIPHSEYMVLGSDILSLILLRAQIYE